MALGPYTRTALLNAIRDSVAEVGLGSQIAVEDALNRAARMVYVDVDLRSAKRKAVITPNIFDDVYIYTAPTDLKEYAIIDIKPQKYPNRKLDSRVKLVTPEVFDRKKSNRNLFVSVEHDSMVDRLLVNIDVDDTKKDVSSFDTLGAGGSTNWIIFGDATNIVLDTNNKVEGGGSLRFDLVGSGTTAGLENTALTSFGIGTDYVDAGYATCWIYINATANLTNFIIRIGSSSTVYHSITATTDHAGNAFVAGWNLIRWNFADRTTTGSPDNSAIDYVAVYMTKTSGKSDDGYRLDILQLHTGEIYEIYYYSRYPWQDSSAAYLENSTAAGDYINADTDEIDLIAARTRMEFARRRRDYTELADARVEYSGLLQTYKFANPSERLPLESEYYR